MTVGHKADNPTLYHNPSDVMTLNITYYHDHNPSPLSKSVSRKNFCEVFSPFTKRSHHYSKDLSVGTSKKVEGENRFLRYVGDRESEKEKDFYT
ncbi:hypothetical protein CDAR_246381 [Caerostris darwini]|uniref:Ycf1 n=1 Tax=Caerostris darwini TaxID=1538125 RepID=A0AAV4W3S8_9ARAC|nr:hypothetical protein CDAR_246381 [Caerostris darwini]